MSRPMRVLGWSVFGAGIALALAGITELLPPYPTVIAGALVAVGGLAILHEHPAPAPPRRPGYIDRIDKETGQGRR